jgi:hypothetical protein
MTQSKEKSLIESVLETIFNTFLNLIGTIINKLLNLLVDLIFYLLSKVKTFFLQLIYRFRRKDNRIIYGRTKEGKVIFDYPINRNQHTYIKGKPGFGKSALAVNLALQNIEQGTAGIFIDPHGNSQATKKKKKGAVVEIFQRAKDVSNVVFFSVNQKHKVIGYNPLFLMGSLDELEELKDYLMNTIFYNSVNSINNGQEVADMAVSRPQYFGQKFLFENLEFKVNSLIG